MLSLHDAWLNASTVTIKHSLSGSVASVILRGVAWAKKLISYTRSLKSKTQVLAPKHSIVRFRIVMSMSPLSGTRLLRPGDFSFMTLVKVPPFVW